MMINKDNLNNINSIDIYNNYRYLFTEIITSFAFLNLEDSYFTFLIIDEINKSKESYNGTIIYDGFISGNIRKRLKNITKERLNNDNTKLNTLNEYINFKFQKINGYRDASKSFNIFDAFLKSLNFVIEPDLMVNLINTNPTIKTMLVFIFHKYGKAIISGDINNLFNNDTLILALKIYCDIENIDIYDELSDDDALETGELSDDLSSYLNSISGYTLLSKEEEKELGKRAANGDQIARNKLIEHNLKLVIRIATMYKIPGEIGNLSLMDLVQEGNIGLMKAVDKYDYKLETKFSTYARWWIKQTIIRAINEKSRNIRVPEYIINEVSRIKKVQKLLEQNLGRQPNNNELSNYLNMPISKIEKLLTYKDDTYSLDEQFSFGEGSDSWTFKDIIRDDEFDLADSYEKKELKSQIHKLIESLNFNEKELFIIYSRFGFYDNKPKTLEYIGKELGITKERVRQIEARAIDKFHKNFKGIIDLSVFLDCPNQGVERIKNISKIDKKSTSKTKYRSINSRSKDLGDNPKIITLDSVYEYFAKYSDIIIDSEDLVNNILNQEIQVNGTTIKGYTIPTDFKLVYSGITIEDCDLLFKMINNPVVIGRFNGLKTIELMMILLKYGYINKKSFSTATIASFFNIEYHHAYKMIKEALNKSKLNLYQVNQVSRKLIKDEENNM